MGLSLGDSPPEPNRENGGKMMINQGWAIVFSLRFQDSSCDSGAFVRSSGSTRQSSLGANFPTCFWMKPENLRLCDFLQRRCCCFCPGLDISPLFCGCCSATPPSAWPFLSKKEHGNSICPIPPRLLRSLESSNFWCTCCPRGMSSPITFGHSLNFTARPGLSRLVQFIGKSMDLHYDIWVWVRMGCPIRFDD